MRGIRRHTHEDRQRVIEEMIPLIRKKFGDNLIALAATGSVARGDDGPYSDLELTAFVREVHPGREWDGFGKIRDGMLVELIWQTKKTYLRRTRDVVEDWHLAGSDVLLAVINAPFIAELNAWRPADVRAKCLKRAAAHWYEVQEAATKVLNAVEAGNRDGIGLLAWDMLRHMLIVLSFLNGTPYVTFGSFISQARGFSVTPASFQALAEMMVAGQYQDTDRLRRLTETTFSEFEEIFEGLGLELYDDNVDPNVPVRGRD